MADTLQRLKFYLPMIIFLAIYATALIGMAAIWNQLLDKPISSITFNSMLSSDEYKLMRDFIDHLPSSSGPEALEEIAQHLDTLPWVDVDKVFYQAPGEVHVAFTRNPMVAYWGPSHVISQEGDVYSLDQMPKDHISGLPMVLISGKRSPADILSVINCVKQANFMLESISSLGADSLTVSIKGLPKIRVLNQEACKHVGRLYQVIAMLKERKEIFSQIDYIDMRYKNAFSIKKL